MADSSLFSRLKRLFSTDVLIRNVGGHQLKVVDTARIQSDGNINTNRRIDRFSRVFSTNSSGYSHYAGQLQLYTRLELFRDYEAMDSDSIIASALDIYADECLHGETVIPLLNGQKHTIKQLYESGARDFWLYGLDGDNTFKPVKADRVAYNGKKKVYAITLDDGTVLRCTSNHIWITPDGKEILTSELQVGGAILALSTKKSTNKNLSGYEQIWTKNQYQFTHRLVAAKNKDLQLQKKSLSEKKCVIHHASFDKLNNDPTQLVWLDWLEHNKVHADYNRQLWVDRKLNPPRLAAYREKMLQGHARFWQTVSESFKKQRALKLRQHLNTLSSEDKKQIYGHRGCDNGMYGQGHKVARNRNGRYQLGLDRLETIDLAVYKQLLATSEGKPLKAVQSHFNLNQLESTRINKHLYEEYGCNNLKQLVNCIIVQANALFMRDLRAFCKDHYTNNPTRRIPFADFCKSQALQAKQGHRILRAAGYKSTMELATSSNHRIVSICEEGLADVYDIVNVGDNHIFAIEAIDGSKLYTHNCSVQNEFGDVISISTTNEKVHKVLHNLFYDVLNIEFNLWPWIRNTLKYGDFFLKLNVAEKFGVIGVEPISAYEMIREENYDPEHPQKVRFRRDPTALSSKYSTQAGSREEVKYDNYEIAHFRLLTDTNFLPYGRSLVEPARKVWKQLCLMEDAMLIHRIMRAPDKRLFKIDIGNIPPNEIDAFMELTIAKMKKVPYVDPQTGDYNLKYNMQNILEDFYFPVRGSESATTVENISGLQSDAIQDIEYLRNRMLASLKIPKAYIGYEEDTSGKSTLASQDFRFARTVERIQRIIVSELYKIAIVHLYSQEFEDRDLVDFTLELTAPSTIYEKEKVELWQSKATLAGDLIEKKLFSRYWIYRQVWNMHEEEYLEEQNRLLQDAKDQFRLEQIKSEGNDPVKTGQSFGTPHDIATLYKGDAGVPRGYDERRYDDRTANMPDGGWPGAGRPKEPGTYGTHKHPLGWDPVGVKGIRNIKEEISPAKRFEGLINRLHEKKKKALKETLEQQSTDNSDQTLLSEDNLLPEE